MTPPLLFMDTETTGLDPADHIWEWAAIRRETDGSEMEWHAFIDHDLELAAGLPEPFRSDHDARYDPAKAINPRELAGMVAALTRDAPHVVGCVPNFDTERLARLYRRTYRQEPTWHHHLIDVENLAAGWLAGYREGTWSNAELIHTEQHLDEAMGHDRHVAAPPWDSDELSRACGIEPPPPGVRHTAMGDVRWAKALYDHVMTSTR